MFSCAFWVHFMLNYYNFFFFFVRYNHELYTNTLVLSTKISHQRTKNFVINCNKRRRVFLPFLAIFSAVFWKNIKGAPPGLGAELNTAIAQQFSVEARKSSPNFFYFYFRSSLSFWLRNVKFSILFVSIRIFFFFLKKNFHFTNR